MYLLYLFSDEEDVEENGEGEEEEESDDEDDDEEDEEEDDEEELDVGADLIEDCEEVCSIVAVSVYKKTTTLDWYVTELDLFSARKRLWVHSCCIACH